MPTCYSFVRSKQTHLFKRCRRSFVFFYSNADFILVLTSHFAFPFSLYYKTRICMYICVLHTILPRFVTLPIYPVAFEQKNLFFFPTFCSSRCRYSHCHVSELVVCMCSHSTSRHFDIHAHSPISQPSYFYIHAYRHDGRTKEKRAESVK